MAWSPTSSCSIRRPCGRTPPTTSRASSRRASSMSSSTAGTSSSTAHRPGRSRAGRSDVAATSRGVRSLSPSRLATIYLVVTAAGFGGTWVAAPWATAEIAPLTVAPVRFALAAVLLLGWCVARGLPLRLGRPDLPVVAGVALTSVAGYNVLFLYGVTLAPASHGAVIVPGLIPMATLVLSSLVLGSRVATRQVAGIVLSIVGLALVVGPQLGGDARTLAGDAMFAVSALIWAAYTLIGPAGGLEPAVL